MYLTHVPGVSDQPTVEVTGWNIIRVGPDSDGLQFHILVGYTVDDGMVRTSTPIQEYDKEARTIRTKSGRLYHLIGDSAEPGADLIGTLAMWCQWSGAPLDAVRPVGIEELAG